MYQISNFGNVKSLKNNILLKGDYVKGYRQVELSKKGFKRGRFKVHRLVAEAFIPNPDRKPFVNHKNSQRDDNSFSNLEWCTSLENTSHAIEFGELIRRKDGSNPNSKKLSVSDVEEIKKSLSEGVSCASLGRKYGVSKSNISQIKRGKWWSFPSIKPFIPVT